jgi:pentatricopeptide repeat protein
MKNDKKISPNKITMNSIVDACVKNGDYAKAEKVIDEMKRFGVFADIVTYSSIIKGYLAKNQFEKTISLFQSLTSLRVAGNVGIMNTIIDCCIKSNVLHYAERAYYIGVDCMKLNPNNLTFSLMFKAFGLLGKYNDSKNLYDLCKEKGELSIISVTCYIKTCLLSNHVDEGLEAWRKLKKENIKRDEKAYVSVIKGLRACRQYSKIIDLLEDSLTEEICFKEEFITEILWGFAKKKNAYKDNTSKSNNLRLVKYINTTKSKITDTSLINSLNNIEYSYKSNQNQGYNSKSNQYNKNRADNNNFNNYYNYNYQVSDYIENSCEEKLKNGTIFNNLLENYTHKVRKQEKNDTKNNITNLNNSILDQTTNQIDSYFNGNNNTHYTNTKSKDSLSKNIFNRKKLPVEEVYRDKQDQDTLSTKENRVEACIKTTQDESLNSETSSRVPLKPLAWRCSNYSEINLKSCQMNSKISSKLTTSKNEFIKPRKEKDIKRSHLSTIN